jgi:hypothetical protein
VHVLTNLIHNTHELLHTTAWFAFVMAEHAQNMHMAPEITGA